MAAKGKPTLSPAVLLALAVGALAVPAPFHGHAYAQARVRAVAGGAKLVRMQVTVNKSQTVRMDQPFTDVLVGATEIADVIPLSDQTLYVLGKKVGTTNISILNDQKKVIGVVDVEVGADAASVAEKLAAGGGAGGIHVRGSGDQVILEGTATDAPTVDRAVEIAKSLSPGGVINATTVQSPQQVMLKVRFIEVNRSAGRDLGVRSAYLSRSTSGKTRAIATTGAGGTTADGSVIGSLLSGMAPFATVLARFADNSRLLDLYIDALENKGLVRRLAEPNLVAMSGDSAEFHAGGQIPIPIASQTNAGVPTVTVAYKDFGVRLNFLPTVLANGLINLKLEPEVSDIDQSVGVSTGGGITVPGLTVRRARTTIELRDGQSFALAGLLQNVTERNIEQLPWLGSIPVLGALFRSTDYQSRETELVVIVTPHIVRPNRPGDLIVTPLDTTLPANDADLFLSGKLELDKPIDPSAATPTQKWILANRQKIAGPFGHILPGSGEVAGQAVVVKASHVAPQRVVRAKD